MSQQRRDRDADPNAPSSKTPVVDVDPVTFFAIVAALLIIPVFLAGFLFQ